MQLKRKAKLSTVIGLTTLLSTIFLLFFALFSPSIWCVGGQGGPSPSHSSPCTLLTGSLDPELASELLEVSDKSSDDLWCLGACCVFLVFLVLRVCDLNFPNVLEL